MLGSDNPEAKHEEASAEEASAEASADERSRSAQAAEELQRAEQLQRSVASLLSVIGHSRSAQSSQSSTDARPPPAFLMKKLTEELGALKTRAQTVAPKQPSGNDWLNRECEWPEPRARALPSPLGAAARRQSIPRASSAELDSDEAADDGEWVALQQLPPSSLSTLGYSKSQ
jgi:hypothetical protein